MENWRTDPRVVLLSDGTRGGMTRAGQVGIAEFAAGTYPACSQHGTMVCMSHRDGIWRCLTEECNIGAKVNPTAIRSLGPQLRGRFFYVLAAEVTINSSRYYDPGFELTCPDATCDTSIALDRRATPSSDGKLECLGCHRRYELPPQCPACAGDGYQRRPGITEPIADDFSQLTDGLDRCPNCDGGWHHDWQPEAIESVSNTLRRR